MSGPGARVGARHLERGRDAAPLTVIGIDPLTDPRWLALIAGPPAGLFHSPAWLGVLSDAYGLAPRAYVVTDADGAPRGGVAFCEVADTLGPRVVALPFSDACDPLIDSSETWRRSSGASRPMACRFTCAVSTIRIARRGRAARGGEARALAHAGRRAGTGRAVGRPRGADPPRHQQGRARRRRRSAPLEGVADLREFHRLHVALRKRKYRLLAQPPAFFEAIERRFSDIGGWHPLGAFLGERLIAATIYLRWRDTLYYKFNASDRDALGARPNDLLVWAGITLARRLGCRASTSARATTISRA